MIQLKSATKTYSNGTTAISGLDLKVTSGEFLVLVGPSGCGKSTLLRVIAGLEAVSEGDILIDETVITREEPA